ncbi:MAG: hypothetical protein ACOX7J_08895 [Bacillota bacterium]|jgi:hypothetical protein
MAKKKKVNPRRLPATRADVNRAKREACDLAVSRAFAIFFTVMRDKEGWGNKRLQRLWAEVSDLSDSIGKGYVSVDDLLVTLAEESDIHLV